ncbi:Nudix hydrolase 10 [Capsicum annuum]|uniref:nudix hydrolase 2 isoform X1 n=1 Tax=Capsicum annuum TaxID=4072 RepID=UPI001FB0C605|nr:nudix hydrolase 2 isoform X1 [Capsicum annuum]XP_047254292.1 nudix hydrolase 2 isoform X1 [Capsicum annuum]XP_047254293.1 nudix hydrolase 2 isoform X1 [Capsicum annuum]XP_047254294.1 nudix hydrolase 2 isoform X1 [Capsicum annuum]XP_047254295.1 nudix hydrolase 2 isoform X1 [Capsicum annuum]KAF3616194.1 Nudix hydrolase 10 [Capsicum annuum]
MEKLVFQNGVKKDQLLSAVNDDHGGVIVEFKEPMDPIVFQNMLKASLSKWRLQGKKGVWIKLPIECVNLVETAVEEGFWYHHAEPHYLMLVYWIPKTENTIPANASHRVGIGAIVLNDKRELLVVQENCGRLKGTAVWKIPTGVVEEGEDIFEGAIREVKEETGVSLSNTEVSYCTCDRYCFSKIRRFHLLQIDTEFLEVLAFRQTHKALFEKSDLFFICMMRPLSFDIQKQDLEIEAAQWMPIEEYEAQPFVQKHVLFKYIVDLCLTKAERGYPGFTPVPITSFFDAGASFLYLNNDGLNDENSAAHL